MWNSRGRVGEKNKISKKKKTEREICIVIVWGRMKWKYVESREWVQKKRGRDIYIDICSLFVFLILPFLFHCQFNPLIPTIHSCAYPLFFYCTFYSFSPFHSSLFLTPIFITFQPTKITPNDIATSWEGSLRFTFMGR